METKEEEYKRMVIGFQEDNDLTDKETEMFMQGYVLGREHEEERYSKGDWFAEMSKGIKFKEVNK